MKSAREIRFEKIYNRMQHSKAALMAEYSGNSLQIRNSDKWDYAIPEMYLNYQDGFLFPICDSYRGMPLFCLPDSTVLYLRWEVSYFKLQEGEKEKYLCFDRHGRKYTVTILDEPDQEGGNPSYFRFLPRVRKYEPKRKRR